MNLEEWWQEITGGLVLAAFSFFGGRAVKRVDRTVERVDELEKNTVTRGELADLIRKLDAREESAQQHRQRIYDKLDANLKEQQAFNLRMAEKMAEKLGKAT